MRRIRNPVWKLCITAGYLLFALLMYRLGARCLFRMLLRAPCPGCGMTRALVSLLRGDLGAAFSYHPMVFFLPLMYAYFLWDGRLFGKKADTAVWILLAAGFAAHWLRLLLQQFLPNFVDFLFLR